MISDIPIKIAKVARDYVDLLTWPVVVLVALVLYRDIIRSLLPGSKIKITISGVTFETTLPVIKQSIIESLGDVELTENQWSWLVKLHTQGQIGIREADKDILLGHHAMLVSYERIQGDHFAELRQLRFRV